MLTSFMTPNRSARCNMRDDPPFSVVRYIDDFRDWFDAGNSLPCLILGMHTWFKMHGTHLNVILPWECERNLGGIEAVASASESNCYFPNTESPYGRCYEGAGYERHPGEIVAKIHNNDEAYWSFDLDDFCRHFAFLWSALRNSQVSVLGRGHGLRISNSEKQPFCVSRLTRCGDVHDATSATWQFQHQSCTMLASVQVLSVTFRAADPYFRVLFTDKMVVNSALLPMEITEYCVLAARCFLVICCDSVVGYQCADSRRHLSFWWWACPLTGAFAN